MRDFEIIKDNLHIMVCEGLDAATLELYITAPMEVQISPKEIGVSLHIEDTLIDRAENVWMVEGLLCEELYEWAVNSGYAEFDVVDWGAGCLTTERASQYEYLNEYAKESEVHEYIEEWITKHLDIR